MEMYKHVMNVSYRRGYGLLHYFSDKKMKTAECYSWYSPVFTGWILPRARQVYEQSAMAQTEQDWSVLPSRGAGLSAEAGEFLPS